MELGTGSRIEEVQPDTKLQTLKRKTPTTKAAPPAKKACPKTSDSQVTDGRSSHDNTIVQPRDIEKKAQEDEAWRQSGFEDEICKRKADEPGVIPLSKRLCYDRTATWDEDRNRREVKSRQAEERRRLNSTSDKIPDMWSHAAVSSFSELDEYERFGDFQSADDSEYEREQIISGARTPDPCDDYIS